MLLHLVEFSDAEFRQNRLDVHRQEAVRQQEFLIRIFHGVYGLDIQNCWNGQKYALVKLGLIASPLTFAQEMSSLDDAAKARIDHFVEENREALD